MTDSNPQPVLLPTPSESDLLRLLRGLRYGQLVVQVHDGRLVQIERTERYRTAFSTNSREGSRSA